MTAYTARALSTDRLQNIVEYVSHGFSVGNILGWDGSTWFLSIANSELNSQVVGMVSVVLDVNNFVITQIGFVSNLPISYIAGDEYYLSPTSAGALTNVKPTTPGQFVVALFIPYTLHTGYFAVTPGVEVASAGGGFTWTLIAANQTLAVNNGYFVHGGAPLNNLLLPTTCVVGDTIKVWDIRGNGFTVTQSASQSVLVGSQSSMVGTGGSIASSQLGNLIEIICTVDNFTFTAAPGMSSFNVT